VIEGCLTLHHDRLEGELLLGGRRRAPRCPRFGSCPCGRAPLPLPLPLTPRGVTLPPQLPLLRPAPCLLPPLPLPVGVGRPLVYKSSKSPIRFRKTSAPTHPKLPASVFILFTQHRVECYATSRTIPCSDRVPEDPDQEQQWQRAGGGNPTEGHKDS
jgi:hypothetical protein